MAVDPDPHELTTSPGRRPGRRPTDALLGLLAAAIVGIEFGLILALPAGSTELANDVSSWLRHIPRWLSSAAVVATTIGCIALVVVGLVSLLRTDIRSARNAIAAAFQAAAVGIVAASIWHSENGSVARAVLHGSNPSILVLDTALIAFLVASDLGRRSRWSRWCFLAGAGILLAGVAVDALTPFALGVALFGGLFFGWGVRWCLGAASVRPSTRDLVSWLADCGLSVVGLEAGGLRHGAPLRGTRRRARGRRAPGQS